jgi:hypothetical protein
MGYTLHHGDCLAVLRSLPECSVDAVVTDPPAGIAFMGKAWDKDKGGRAQWVAWMTEVAAECLRVIKPGGHALVWALPVNPPDVGAIEIQIARVYGTIKADGLIIFDDLTGLLGDLQGYAREVDGDGEPTEKIANESMYHYHAALRYIVSRIRKDG